MTTLTPVKSCARTSCSFNDNGCAAFAITVAGTSGTAQCATFIELDARGGLPSASGQVGACQHLECVHNSDLMCTAASIEVDSDTLCLTYEAR